MMSNHRTGDKEIDNFMDQTLITLGGMVKVQKLSRSIGVDEEISAAFDVMTKMYHALIDKVAYSMLQKEE